MRGDFLRRGRSAGRIEVEDPVRGHVDLVMLCAAAVAWRAGRFAGLLYPTTAIQTGDRSSSDTGRTPCY
jgi:hypothetical protein